MDEMKDLQVDYYSITAEILINELNSIKINEDLNYFKNILSNWNYILDKDSYEAGIYIQWEREIMSYFYSKYIPIEAINLLYVQLYTIINKLKSFNDIEKSKFLNETLSSAINKLKEKFGEDESKWVYGQKDYKHIKIKHPLEDVVNDSIKSILEFNTYPRSEGLILLQ